MASARVAKAKRQGTTTRKDSTASADGDDDKNSQPLKLEDLEILSTIAVTQRQNTQSLPWHYLHTIQQPLSQRMTQTPRYRRCDTLNFDPVCYQSEEEHQQNALGTLGARLSQYDDGGSGAFMCEVCTRMHPLVRALKTPPPGSRRTLVTFKLRTDGQSVQMISPTRADTEEGVEAVTSVEFPEVSSTDTVAPANVTFRKSEIIVFDMSRKSTGHVCLPAQTRIRDSVTRERFRRAQK
ncbi:hypothetical protein BaRGS_00039662 [Batillaria attramentaria]|uniref:Uncharacterized protein n=1 Tax=Batillaria attramentaria TaxID=370345 RepID=A0ABD0J2K2_9CAEN